MATTSFGGFGVGNWGTPNDIKAFQKYAKLPITGKVDKKTAFSLDNYSKNNMQSLGLSPSESSFTKATPLTNQYFDSGLYGQSPSSFGSGPGIQLNKMDQSYIPTSTANVVQNNGGGNNESSFLGSLFSQPAAGENGWFSKGKQGLNESDVAYAARLQAPTSFMNTLSGIGTGVSALGGLYNMYQTGKNYDLQKQEYNNKMALAKASEANRSAMAKAFGSSYTPAQF